MTPWAGRMQSESDAMVQEVSAVSYFHSTRTSCTVHTVEAGKQNKEACDTRIVVEHVTKLEVAKVGRADG